MGRCRISTQSSNPLVLSPYLWGFCTIIQILFGFQCCTQNKKLFSLKSSYTEDRKPLFFWSHHFKRQASRQLEWSYEDVNALVIRKYPGKYGLGVITETSCRYHWYLKDRKRWSDVVHCVKAHSETAVMLCYIFIAGCLFPNICVYIFIYKLYMGVGYKNVRFCFYFLIVHKL